MNGTVQARLEAQDWPQVAAALDAQGWALLDQVLTPLQCKETAGLYQDAGRFRSTVVMARHGFGRGEYKYFAYPLPDLVAGLREALYARLAPIFASVPAKLEATYKALSAFQRGAA